LYPSTHLVSQGEGREVKIPDNKGYPSITREGDNKGDIRKGSQDTKGRYHKGKMSSHKVISDG
jgi:hypothetical protein